MSVHICEFVRNAGSRGTRRHLSTVACATALVFSASAATAAVVDPALLTGTIVSVTGEGTLCPPGSIHPNISEDGGAATVVLEAPGSTETASCRLSVAIDVPEGLMMGLPRMRVYGATLDGGTVSRVYSFDGASGSASFSDSAPELFTFTDRSAALRSPSCGASRRVQLVTVVTAEANEGGQVFLDGVELDTSYRFGGDWHFCDPNEPLEVTPGREGEFCDGPHDRPCAEGLVCNHERNPEEGLCAAP